MGGLSPARRMATLTSIDMSGGEILWQEKGSGAPGRSRGTPRWLGSNYTRGYEVVGAPAPLLQRPVTPEAIETRPP